MDPAASTSEVLPDDALIAAHAAASLRPLAIRVAELETLLAVERAEHARRLKETDGLMRSMRHALQNMRSDVRVLRDERDSLIAEREVSLRQQRALEQRVEELREGAQAVAHSQDGVTAEVVASAISRAQSADMEVSRLRRVVSVLRARVVELEGGATSDEGGVVEELDGLHAQLSERDAELVRAAEALRDFEEAARDSEERQRRAEMQVAELRSRMQGSESHDAPQGRFGGRGGSNFPLLASPPRRFADSGLHPHEPIDEPIDETVAATVEGTLGTTTSRPVYDRTESVVGVETAVEEAESDVLPSEQEAVQASEQPAYADSGDVSGLVDETDGGRAEREVTGTSSSSFCGTDVALCQSEADSPGPALEFDETASSAPSAAAALGHDDDDFPGLHLERQVARTTVMETWYARPVSGGDGVTVHALHDGVAAVDEQVLDRLVALRHPNVLPVLSYAAGPRRRHLVCQRAGGERADAWVGRVGPIAERIALAVVLQAARGLASAADRALHHGDLSPASLWVDAAGGVRVEGVGLRAAIAPGRPPEHLSYAAPEQREPAETEPGADVYSLGAVLYFLLTGCAAVALRADPAGEGSGVPDPRDVRGDLSERAARIVELLTANDPRVRPATWEHAIAELESGVSGRPRRAAPPLQRVGFLRRLLARPHVLVGLLAVPCAITAAVLHVQDGFTPTVRESFDRTALRAERLVRLGDVEGARKLYLKFLYDTGDSTVEAAARSRLEDLEAAPR